MSQRLATIETASKEALEIGTEIAPSRAGRQQQFATLTIGSAVVRVPAKYVPVLKAALDAAVKTT
jgi:hypothetical protein|tara:strand:- start:8012 stop:8206 length:195 start_codon:yes stop_codon:yes gene_type:complete